jgi:HEAT repeat protein
MAEKHRKHLQAIVENDRAPGRARDYAAEALLRTEWKGRDEWYVSLFADASLRDLRDGSVLMNPLTSPVAWDPDQWIPVMTRLVASPNRVVHDMAVTCLVMFHLKEARRDALLPLLPWLHDPNWSSAGDRLRLIQSVGDLNMRESIPGLIAVVDQDESTERAYAADALASFKDSRAVTALRRALEQETDDFHRTLIVKGLYSSGGITAEEASRALEAVAMELSTPEGRDRLDDTGRSVPLNSKISVGEFLRDRQEPPSSDTFALSVARIRQLEKDQPAVARAFEEILDRWADPVIDRDFVDRLEHGKATTAAIASAIQKRTSISRNASDALLRLSAGPGLSSGVASAFLMDESSVQEILQGNDVERQAAFLACSRIARTPLPLDSVARLLDSKQDLLREAAERYLEVEDSPRARQLVLSRHVGEAFILGERSLYDPGHSSFESLDALEQRIREMILARNGPDEVFALLSAGYWGDAGQLFVVVRQETADLKFESDDRSTVRKLTKQETTDLRKFIETNKVDDLGPFEIDAVDGIQLEYIHLSKNGGRRVFMNNPQFAPDSIYSQLCDVFIRLQNVPAGKVARN